MTAGESLGGEVVDQFEHHLRGADFGGVDVVGDEDDGLAGAEDLVALGVGGRAALEVELAFQGLQLVEIAQVFGGADFQQDEGIAVGGGAEVAELDAVRAVGDGLHVLDDLVPADQLLVAADAEAEVLLGSLDGGGGGEGKEEEERRAVVGFSCTDFCRGFFASEMNNCREICGGCQLGVSKPSADQ